MHKKRKTPHCLERSYLLPESVTKNKMRDSSPASYERNEETKASPAFRDKTINIVKQLMILVRLMELLHKIVQAHPVPESSSDPPKSTECTSFSNSHPFMNPMPQPNY